MKKKLNNLNSKSKLLSVKNLKKQTSFLNFFWEIAKKKILIAKCR